MPLIALGVGRAAGDQSLHPETSWSWPSPG